MFLRRLEPTLPHFSFLRWVSSSQTSSSWTSSFKPKEAAGGAFLFFFSIWCNVLEQIIHYIMFCWTLLVFQGCVTACNPVSANEYGLRSFSRMKKDWAFKEKLTHRHYVHKHYCLYWSLYNLLQLFTQPCCCAVNTHNRQRSVKVPCVSLKAHLLFWWKALDIPRLRDVRQRSKHVN